MDRTHTLRALFCVSTSAAALVAAPAYAQTAPAPQADNTTEIIVTAQRREETANSVGMGIQAFAGEQLEQLHVTDVKDLSSVAPGFSVSQSYQGVPIYTLRGIGFNTINLSSTSTVGSYVDEVAYPFPFMMTGPIFDIARVEVLKGPQGTLYGRNTTAGLVDFITNRPTDEFEASITGEVGNYDTMNFGGYVSGPLAPNFRYRLAGRVENSNEGWQESNSRDESLGEIHRTGVRARFDWDVTDDFLVELTLTGWTNTSDTIAGQGIGFTPATNPLINPFNAPGLPAYIAANQPNSSTQADWAPRAQRSANIGIGAGLDGPLEEDNSFFAAALRATYDFSSDLRLVSLTGYNHLERDALFDWSGSPFEVLLQQADGEIKTISEEIRLEGENGPARWTIGAYYGSDELRDNNRTLLGQNANVGRIRAVGSLILSGIDPLTYNPPGVVNPLLIPGYAPGPYTLADMATAFRTYRDRADMEAETRSVFANAEWTLSDSLSLTTGVRYTEDEHSYRGCSADFNGSMLPNVNAVNRYLYTLIYAVPTPAPIAMNGCNTYDPISNTFGEVSHTLAEDNVSWRTALEWQATDNALFYVSVSEGTKAGVTPVNAASTSTQQLPARQEMLRSYEAGAKLGLFDRAVQLNASVFYYDYEDKQLQVYFQDPIYTALARLANVPDSEALGVDADITWRVTDDLTLIGSATWLDTRVNGYNGINASGVAQLYDGNAFPYSPTWQTSGTIVFDRPISDSLGLQAALNGRWQSESAADLGDSPTFAIDSYGLLNGSIGIHDLDDRWELSLWGRNLTDTYYWTAVASNANVVVRFPGQARTYGASLTFNF
jgi:outer membrane receptor protein involved in Fe transport